MKTGEEYHEREREREGNERENINKMLTTEAPLVFKCLGLLYCQIKPKKERETKILNLKTN